MSTNLVDSPATGLVVAYFGKTIEVEARSGAVIHCRLRRNQALPVVGDSVEFQSDTETTGFVTRILPRRSVLAKANYYGQQKLLVANIDYVLVTMAPQSSFSTYLIDRYLAAAALQEIDAIIIVNKMDLAEDKAQIESLLQPYQQIPYQTVCTSAQTGLGINTLKQILAHKSAVLVGPSGVGKSSIINSICAEVSIRTGEVSAKGTGRHTTTATRLYHTPNGGSLLDSPGVREFNLCPVPPDHILRGFKEFVTFTGNCKYRNCSHSAEPGCTLREALTEGKINDYRYQHFLTLRQEMIEKYKKNRED